MADARKALIVATDQYSDTKLTRLNAPAEDARALAEVLKDPDVGAYEVETVLNKTCQEVEIAIASFFQAGARGDTLLLHFSCHGVKDLSGELYFATTDTKLPLLKVTAVSSSMVKTAMEESRASLILCLVDCCYSGAFTKFTKAAATVDLTERLGGRGRAVITASTSLQLALDGKEEPSLFTHAVVEGLRSGEADRDLDGLVTLDEFYNYVHETVTAKNPDQTPVKSFDVQGEVYVARRGAPISTPAPLPKELSDTLAVGEDWQRMGAVSRLTDLLNSGHPGRALAARLELERVRDNDDSIKVRRSAAAALEAAGEAGPMPTIPTYVERDQESAAADTTVEHRSVEDTAAVDSTQVEKGPAETRPRPVVDPGGPGDGTTGGRGPEHPVANRHWKGILLSSAAVLAVLVGLTYVGLTWGDGGGGGNADQVTTRPEVLGLSESELLVPVAKDGRRVLEAVDVDSETFDSRDLVNDVDLPTLSHDRQWMSFIRDVGAEQNRVVYLAQVDPFREAAKPLLDQNARSNCPSSSRPAVNPLDGVTVALVCRFGPIAESGNSLGLYSAGIEGTHIDENGLVPVLEDSRVIEAPTWTGDNELIFVADEIGPEGQWTLMVIPASGEEEPEPLTDGTSGWDTHPDWSEAGVIFLRSSEPRKPGNVFVLEEGEVVRQLTFGDNSLWPTWSPDGTRIAYLKRDDAGVRSLWVLDVGDPEAEPRQIELDGNPGPPAWSDR